MADFTTLLGQYVFPIVMCLIMAWYVKDQSDAHREEVKQINQQHKEETARLADTIQNNTIAVQKLTDLVEDMRRDGKD